METTTIVIIFGLIQGVIILLLGVSVRGIMSINVHLGKLNGDVQSIRKWADGHEKIDDERHRQHREDSAAIWSRLEKKE